MSAARTLWRGGRWTVALPFRLVGQRHVRLLVCLGILALFLFVAPMDAAFYPVFFGWLALSMLSRPLGRWITPKPLPLVMPKGPSHPPPMQAVSPAPAPPPDPSLPREPDRPSPARVQVALPPQFGMLSPDEMEIRRRLSPKLQALLTTGGT